MSVAVVTVTPNPAIDLTVTIERLVGGTVHRSRATEKHCGGKGINVAACLADWGTHCHAAGLLGEENALPFELFLAARRIGDGFVRIPGETRTNIKLLEQSGGETTDINLAGPPSDASALAVMIRRLEATLAPTAWPAPRVLVLAGSLPPSLPADTYRRLVARLSRPGLMIVLDSSGEAMDAALAEGAVLPFCIKPNRHELETHVGRALPELDDVANAAATLVRRGVGLVAVSLGAEGALLVDARGAVHAAAPPVEAGSTVGAGDAMVAGLVSGLVDGLALPELAARGVAFAAAKLGRTGAGLPDRAEVEAIEDMVQVRPVQLGPAPAGAGSAEPESAGPESAGPEPAGAEPAEQEAAEPAQAGAVGAARQGETA